MTNTLLQVAASSHPSSTATIVVTAISTIGAGGVLKLVQMWIQFKKEKQIANLAPVTEYKDSLKERIVELEDNLEKLRIRIEELITMYSETILVLSTEKATLIAKLESALSDNALLREELQRLNTK